MWPPPLVSPVRKSGYLAHTLGWRFVTSCFLSPKPTCPSLNLSTRARQMSSPSLRRGQVSPPPGSPLAPQPLSTLHWAGGLLPPHSFCDMRLISVCSVSPAPLDFSPRATCRQHVPVDCVNGRMHYFDVNMFLLSVQDRITRESLESLG